MSDIFLIPDIYLSSAGIQTEHHGKVLIFKDYNRNEMYFEGEGGEGKNKK